MHLVDDIDLVAAARRRELHAPNDLLAHVLHARAAGGVQLVHVGMLPVGDGHAVVARAVRFGGGTFLA